MKRIQGSILRAVIALFAVLPLTALAQAPDIVITIDESADPVFAGVQVPGNLTYVVRVDNEGDADATGLQLSVNLTLPPGVTVEFVNTVAGTWSGTFPGTFDIGDLDFDAGFRPSFEVELTVAGTAGAATDAISITANVSALNETDSDPSNDSAAEATSITTIATFNISKDFSDDSTAAVEVQLSCSGGQVDLDPPITVSEGQLVGVAVTDFPAGTSCTATETVPAGYSASYAAGCTIDPIESTLGNYSCLITNTQLPVQLVVNKTFTDGNDADVTIDLVCGAGTVTADDPTASNSDPAEFTISDFPAAGTTCTATETLPAGYSQQSSTCTNVAITVGSTPSCEFVNVPTRATFAVTKIFTDANPGEIEATISCNTGLPIEQSQEVSPGAPIEFVVGDFDIGELDCTITEDGEAGYIASYYDGTTTSDSGCEFLDVAGGAELSCQITNTPAPVDLDITKQWVIEGDASGVDPDYNLTVYCDAEIVGGSSPCLILAADAPASPATWCISVGGSGPGSDEHTVQVIPGYPSSSCWVEEQTFDDAIETDNGCLSLTVSAGVGDACTITNTVVVEGIPTLSQYGRILLMLLVLGVGLAAYRRIV